MAWRKEHSSPHGSLGALPLAYGSFKENGRQRSDEAGVHRLALVNGSVVYLDARPTRLFEVIGIITPAAGEYETEAEAGN